MIRLTFLATTLGAMMVSPAQAQDANRKPGTDDDIVVTAQKRQQHPVDVDLTLSAIGQERLRDSRVVEMRDIPNHVSNVDVREQAPGALPVITIRGVGLNDFSATNNPSAGVYVDEIYLSSLSLLSFDFYDLERVEVLKGPQGTLYGRNSTAGAINFISARPNFQGASGLGSATYGNYDTAEIEGVANLPVSDTVAIRLSAKEIHQGRGFYFNRTTGQHVGNRQVALGRAQIRWRPSSNADINLKIDGFDIDSTLGQGSFFGAYDFNNPPTFRCAALDRGTVDPACTSPFGYRDQDHNPYAGDWAAANFYKAHQIAGVLRGVFDLGGVELTSVTGFIRAKGRSYSDIDSTPATALEFIQSSDIHQYSQEFRLAGKLGDRFTWLVGAFGSDDRIRIGSEGLFDDFFRTRTSQSGDQETRSLAGFVNGEFSLTPAIKFVAGLRLTWEDKKYTARVFDDNPFGTSCLISATCSPGATPPVLIASATDAKIDDTNLSWKFGVDWKPAPRTLFYASVSRGVKSGGFFSGFASDSISFLPFKPESIIAYEIGAKHESSNGAFSVAASTFYYDYSNIQTFIRDQTVAIPVQRLGNVDKARVYGADLDVTVKPPMIEGLTITTGVGLLDTELGSFPALGGVVPRGNRLPNAPAFTVNALARYEHPIGGGLRGVIQVDGRYASATQKDALNNPIIAADGYSLWNGRIGLGPENGRWELAIWSKNLFNTVYKVQGVDITSLGFGYENYNAPRTFGSTFSVKF